MAQKKGARTRTRETAISKTASLCPECTKTVPADIFERDGKVWIRKRCPKHGTVEDLYSGDAAFYRRAKRYAHDGRGVTNPSVTKTAIRCPQDCGLCRMHKSHTALANIAVTTRCDLRCWYCFFYSEKLGYVYEPTLEQIREMVRNLRGERPVPCNAVQLTGGEPTLRDDIIDIIRICKEEGIDHVQLNTNGTRIARDLGFTMKVREAGVNTLYLSFDGVTPKTNPKNHWEIPGVLENCRKAGIGIVLVPTMVKGINDHEIGDIVRFGFENNDVVRGVNIQPVSLVGMISRAGRQKMRITIPDVIDKLEQQTDNQIGKSDFYPVPTLTNFTRFVEALVKKPQYDLSSHFACGAATYVFRDDSGRMLPLPRFADVDGFLDYLGKGADELRSGKNRYVVGLKLLRNIGKFIDKKKAPKGFSLPKIIYNALMKHDYSALGDFHHKSLFIGIMHFMDKWNYDIERVKRCTIHYAMTDGRIIPFCAFNVIPEWYRDASQKSQGMDIPKWEKSTGRKLADDIYKRNIKELENTELYRKTYKGFVKGV
jgi:uncharacterized radical SAM superfamily Fe-S cluster-containing enzyme